MLRRMFVKLCAAFVVAPIPRPVQERPAGQTVRAVHTFAGQGTTYNVDTGLRYQGKPVSPTFVTITPAGWHISQQVGVFIHDYDTRIDVECADVPWIGKAEYIQ